MTPGPWTYKQTYNGGAGSIVGPDGRGVACISGAIKRPKEENLANAKVLAAGPLLIAALLDARQFALSAIRANVDLPDFDPTEHVTVRKIDAALLAAGVTP